VKLAPPARILFVTGTDTGVGKTVLTALLLHHLRRRGVKALATKPFCSGGRADLEVLQALQPGELTPAEVNPFYFPEPLAPLVAARRRRRRITLAQTLEKVQPLAAHCQVLLIEGAGGLLAPLGENFTAADLIRALGCEAIVAGRNQLGTINHTLLTVGALQAIDAKRIAFVLMNVAPPRLRLQDPSTGSNRALLAQWLHPVPVLEIPFLGPNPTRIATLKKIPKKIQKKLALLLA
jgi:dethiobiotin synthetase